MQQEAKLAPARLTCVPNACQLQQFIQLAVNNAALLSFVGCTAVNCSRGQGNEQTHTLAVACD